MTGVFAAALERSNQSISAFLEPGNYIEAELNVTDMSIKGKTTDTLAGAFNNTTSVLYTAVKNNDLGDIGKTYLTPKVSAKIQASEHFSIGLMYDEPYKINTHYNNNSLYFYTDTSNVRNPNIDKEGQTSLKISTKSISLLGGYQPSTNWNIFAGITNQQLDGSTNNFGRQFNIYTAASSSSAYSAKFEDNNALGWLIGLAYNNDEFKTSLTYRSEIKHKFQADEYDNLDSFTQGALGANTIIRDTAMQSLEAQSTFKTPQSVNFEISKALSNKTISSLGVRWVDWSNAGLHLPFYEARSKIRNLSTASNPNPTTTPPENTFARSKNEGYDILQYNKDQWNIDLSIDHKLTEKWKLSGTMGWDSGIGYVSNFTPDSGSFSAGVGVQYNPASNYFVETGFKYYWLKDVKGQHAKQVSDNLDLNDTLFENNYALSYDFKIGYRF